MIRQYIRGAADIPNHEVDYYSGFKHVVKRNFHNYWDLWLSYYPVNIIYNKCQVNVKDFVGKVGTC